MKKATNNFNVNGNTTNNSEIAKSKKALVKTLLPESTIPNVKLRVVQELKEPETKVNHLPDQDINAEDQLLELVKTEKKKIRGIKILSAASC
ncbi:MAG: hypothetical protein F6J94_06490 [Moorea sp. SIO1F2]|uniref:hypothetical protein n=1 Tax=unclassified Moorena TaxID=2683338 RepID=UPI0013B6D1A8|nr:MULTISPECIES: hypothetical protein [unclassified Moorena]NEN96505.1 hypothetical protein [Moorena sp. SIO3I7]NEO08533.1 hypothetical protein [Moorena sp. SIO3I8]NEO21759.1 hypothetical protein [Moorena sp. SIO4A5]NEP20733.1 hypothetical protein [Moorena sp. SIO3I6]NEQ60757.1 hypothetical protein [Moorena sp. SIO4A1]